LALGSWLLALGSWLLALGSWLLALGSWLFIKKSLSQNKKNVKGLFLIFRNPKLSKKIEIIIFILKFFLTRK
jgi:hypothetical protein